MTPRKPGKPPRKSRARPPSGQRRGGVLGSPGAGPEDRQSYWLFGQHAVLAALGNPRRDPRRLMMTREAARRVEGSITGAHGRQLPEPEIVQRQEIERILPAGAVHQGLALLVEPLPEQGIESLETDRAGRMLLVALDQVTDPQNVGAILRSCAAFGAAGLLLTRRNAPSESGTLAKAASGALEHVALFRETNLARSLGTLGEHGFLRIGLAEQGPQVLSACPRAERVCLVLGAEGRGLRALTRERCDLLARLPTRGPIEALNVSSAAAIALYELLGRG